MYAKGKQEIKKVHSLPLYRNDHIHVDSFLFLVVTFSMSANKNKKDTEMRGVGN
jgi:hypothetical protein